MKKIGLIPDITPRFVSTDKNNLEMTSIYYIRKKVRSFQ